MSNKKPGQSPAKNAMARKAPVSAKAKAAQLKSAKTANVTSAKPAKPAPTRAAEAVKVIPNRPAVVRKTKGASEADFRRIDRDILKLVHQRAEMFYQQLKHDAAPRVSLFTPAMDDELYHQLEAVSQGPLPFPAIKAIFREIMSATRQRVRTSRVAYLGPQFSFTHIAAIDRFGSSADLVPASTIAAVFDEVNRGHVDFGIVPIENSTDGRIVDTLDMFQRLPLKICGEVQISVHHNLLSRTPRSEITEIYSKPQALSQCRDWLARNLPDVRLVDVTSTSTAAQIARDKPGAGAIASRQAAVQYGLDIVANNIEDNPHNVTRFAVIGEETTKPSGRDRTAILLQIPHTPGSLSDTLSAFKKNKVNLTWIESFPLRGGDSEYLFFLDFEGHIHDAKIRKTLSDLEKKALSLRMLGSYPRSEPIE
jgi:chorismate mutase/prephenate dehydratase